MRTLTVLAFLALSAMVSMVVSPAEAEENPRSSKTGVSVVSGGSARLVVSAEDTAAKYGWQPESTRKVSKSPPAPGYQNDDGRTPNPPKRPKYYNVSLAGATSSGGRGYGGGSNLLSGIINFGTGMMFGGSPGYGGAPMLPFLGGSPGYGGSAPYGNSAEAQAYREGYERERASQQRDRERSAEEAGRTDARQGTYNPFQFYSPGEQTAYRRGLERERDRIRRERERAAYDAGRNAAGQPNPFGW